MLKLTNYNAKFPVYVSPRHITGMELVQETTNIWVTGRTTPFCVKETPEQIMAMPEMLYEAYPLMVISGKDQNIAQTLR